MKRKPKRILIVEMVNDGIYAYMVTTAQYRKISKKIAPVVSKELLNEDCDLSRYNNVSMTFKLE